jgi:hypothetical protein
MALAAVMLLPADLPLLAVCGVALSASLFAVISAPFSGWVRISPALAGFAVAVATASGHFRTLPVPFSPQVNAPDPLLQIGQPLDPTQLYVGDAPSLMASGSVLAVAVGILTLYTWHRLLRQRRGGIVLWPLAGFLIADTAVAAVARIDLGSQILQGPALFAAGLLAGDSRLMDDHPAAGLAAGMAGGALAAVLRAAGAGVAAAPLAMTLGMLVATPIQHVRLNLGDRRARTTRSLLPRPRPPQSAEDAAAQAEPPAEGA